MTTKKEEAYDSLSIISHRQKTSSLGRVAAAFPTANGDLNKYQYQAAYYDRLTVLIGRQTYSYCNRKLLLGTELGSVCSPQILS